MTENKCVYAYTNPSHPRMGYVGFINVSTNAKGEFVVNARTEGPGDQGSMVLSQNHAEMMAQAILKQIADQRVASQDQRATSQDQHTAAVAEAERADDAATGMTVESAAKIIAGHYGADYIVTTLDVDEPGLPAIVSAAKGFVRNYCDQESFTAYQCYLNPPRACEVHGWCPWDDRCKLGCSARRTLRTPIGANAGGGPGS
jgi:hypothetical protein